MITSFSPNIAPCDLCNMRSNASEHRSSIKLPCTLQKVSYPNDRMVGEATKHKRSLTASRTRSLSLVRSTARLWAARAAEWGLGVIW